MAMERPDNTEIIDRFLEFYRTYCADDIGTLAQAYPNDRKSLYLDWEELYRFDRDMAEDYVAKPGQMQDYAEEALRLYDLPADVKLGNAHVRMANLGETTGIRDIRERHHGTLISVQGTVNKTTSVRPKLQQAAFECQRCGTLSYIPQASGFTEPHECEGCERQGPFDINFEQSEFVDAQTLRVQESPEGLRGGQTPEAIDVNIEDDVTGEVTAGDHVRVTGILRLEQQGNQQEKSLMFEKYIQGVSVEVEDEEFEEMNITEADKQEIIELAADPDIYDKMVQSMAPSIWGYETHKQAIIFQLFSGVTKHLPDNSRIRGDLHMLLIGDPGTGKCQKFDTKVTLADGRERELGYLVEENLDDPVPVDDGVYDSAHIPLLSVTESGESVQKTATRVWKREAPTKMYRISTRSGREIEVTPSHPIFQRAGTGMEPVVAESLQEGEFIAVPSRLGTKGDDRLNISHRRSDAPNANSLDTPTEATPELGRLLGYIVGEGHIEETDSSAAVVVTNADEEILSDTEDCLDSLGLRYWRRPHHEKPHVEIVGCSSVEFVDFLERLEPAILERSAEQRVPDCMRRASQRNKRAFLRAYVDGEATVSSKERELCVASMSHDLLEGVRSMLLEFGIESQLQTRNNGSSRLRISGTNFERYRSKIGFITARKAEAAAEFTSEPNTNRSVVPDVDEELERIRCGLGLSQFDCGIPRTTYQHYERGDRNPSKESLATVLSAFQERLEKLESLKSRIQSGGWSEIQEARELLGLSQDALAAGTSVTQGSISNYDLGEVAPDGGVTVEAGEVLIERIDEALDLKTDVRELEALATGDLGWDRIESIDRVEPEYDWVYDLEVADTHRYVGGGVISHNSKLLQYVKDIAPRSVYTSGKGSSAAGLTATAVRDDFGEGDQWSLEAGALVLADKGIAAIDELDKMDAGDRSAMHEALEQQSYHPDTEILLADGRRVEMGELVDGAMAAHPDDVVDGVDCEILPTDDIRVHSVNLDGDETTKLPVDRVSRHEAPDEFVRVTFSNGREVTVTPEHPMFVGMDGETTPAAELDPGAFVPAPRKLPNSAAPVGLPDEPSMDTREKDLWLPNELTADLAELLGLLVAEGHSYAGSSHEIGFSNQDERLLDRAELLAKRAFGIEPNRTTNAAGTVTLRWISTRLHRWFEATFPEFMHTAREKRIPARVLGASEEHIRRFLVGAFAGDGGVESEAMSFSTASDGLAEDYMDALAKLGIASRIHHDSAENSWKVYVMGDSTERFVEAVVEPTDDRHDDAVAFAERSESTPRHHDVLPTAAARELRELKRLVGIPLTGEFRANLDEEFGVQIGTVRGELAGIRERIASIRESISEAEDLGAIRALADWSARQLAERLDGITKQNIDYAERGGYDPDRRAELSDRARTAVRTALDEAADRTDALESACDLRYYRVTDTETVANAGDHATEWVYDVTVEPTNTFVSKGVVLHNSISVSKAGINATLKSRCSLLGAANPKYGRFDEYESISEQIDLEPALISRFDLIFTITDKPDEEEDRRLAQHIIETNYAGELHTHRENVPTANVSEQEVATATEDVEPVLDADLFRKYVAHAKRSCYPTMTDEARSAIEEFYVDLRSRGEGEDAPVPVTARKLEALVRLAEASARVRLSDTVEQEDADRVIDIVRTSLEDVGMDPETNEFDADMIEAGHSKSQRDRMKGLKAIIQELEDEYEEGAPYDEVLEMAVENDTDRDKAEHEIEKFKQRGEVYEPSQGHLRTT